MTTCLVGKDCCIPVWGVAAMAGAGFVMLVVILVLSVCLCRARRRGTWGLVG